MQKLNVGDNKPYKGDLVGDSMYRHGLRNKLPHALIEVRNDLLSNPVHAAFGRRYICRRHVCQSSECNDN